MSVEGLSKRQLSAKKAEKLIVAEVAHCMKLCSERRFTSMIRAYREQVDSIRAQEIEKAIKALAAGGDPVNILQMMARSLTNKLMHEPSVQLRHAGYHGRIDVLEAAKRILGIGEPCFSLEDGIVSELNE
jgi:glutamyl-tRNA reductase